MTPNYAYTPLHSTTPLLSRHRWPRGGATLLLLLSFALALCILLLAIASRPNRRDDDDLDDDNQRDPLFTTTTTNDEHAIPALTTTNPREKNEEKLVAERTPTGKGRMLRLNSKRLAKLFLSNAGDEKYFMYNYNGGFNNQREDLQTALMLMNSVFPNRTLVIPVASSHRFFPPELWKHHMLPADEIFDFQLLLRYLPRLKVIVMTNPLTMSDFTELKLTSLNMDTDTRKRHPLTRSQLEQFAKEWRDRGVIYFGDDTMWQSFGFSREERRRAARHLRFEFRFRHAAATAIESLFRDESSSSHISYLSTHIRQGDFYKAHPKAGWLKDVDSWFLNQTLIAMREHDEIPSTRKNNMYICTEKKTFSSFPKLAARFHLVGFQDVLRLPSSPWIVELEPVLPTDKARKETGTDSLRNTLVGILEMLIASCADVFVGSPASTFSEGIDVIRENRDVLFPECERIRGTDASH